MYFNSRRYTKMKYRENFSSFTTETVEKVRSYIESNYFVYNYEGRSENLFGVSVSIISVDLGITTGAVRRAIRQLKRERYLIPTGEEYLRVKIYIVKFYALPPDNI